MTPTRDERGQVLALTVLALAALIGIAALVLDVGAWFQTKRKLQGTADAAALAGAQVLPEQPAQAASLALAYANRNGGNVSGDGVSISNDEITVRAATNTPGFFSQVFHIGSVNVGAAATARSQPLGAPRYVAPIAISQNHPLLLCTPQPCFDQPTQLNLADLHSPGSGTAAGSFGLINLDQSDGGSVANNILADWLRNGFGGELTTGDYTAAPGASFGSSDFQSALRDRIGDELLFPVYSTITGSGAPAIFHVVGWVGFTLTSFSTSGSSGALYGHFTRVTWDGDVADGASLPDFGVRTVSLIR